MNTSTSPFPHLLIINPDGDGKSLRSACLGHVRPSMIRPLKFSTSVIKHIIELFDPIKHWPFTSYDYMIVDCSSEHELAADIAKEIVLAFPKQAVILVDPNKRINMRYPTIRTVSNMREVVAIVRDKK